MTLASSGLLGLQGFRVFRFLRFLGFRGLGSVLVLLEGLLRVLLLGHYRFSLGFVAFLKGSYVSPSIDESGILQAL